MSTSGMTIATAIAPKNALGDAFACDAFLRTNGVSVNSGRTGVIGSVHSCSHSLLLRMPFTIRSAVRLTTKVMVNSRMPMRNSTW